MVGALTDPLGVPGFACSRFARKIGIALVRGRIARPAIPPMRAIGSAGGRRSSGLEAMRSGVKVETDLAPLQSQTRLERLPGLRLEALEHRAATLF